MVITFKSNNENFIKEKSGVKNNTFRKVDLNDERFLELLLIAKRGIPNELGKIRIQNADIIWEADFEREITDITFWDGYVIITWKHEENGQ